MTRKALLKFSLINFIIAIFVFAFNYFFFHFVTDTGIGLTWNPEPGKPFVSNLIGTLGVLFVFSSISSLAAAFVFTKKE